MGNIVNHLINKATGYGLDDRCLIPDMGRDIGLHHHIKTSSGTHSASLHLKNFNSPSSVINFI
jgi:hypothetical protein